MQHPDGGMVGQRLAFGRRTDMDVQLAEMARQRPCCARSIGWSRKKITWNSASASCRSVTSRFDSGLVRSMSAISAPICGVSGVTLMDW